MENIWSRRWVGVSSVAVLVIIAFALRVWGAGWSLPYVDHPDEPAVVKAVLRIVKGSYNPKHFFYPSLIIYAQALVFKIHFWWGLHTDLYSAPLTLPNSTHFYTTIPGAFVWGRVFTALLGTATVASLATWGGRFIGQREGLLAAALLACSWWAVVHDHYLTVDGPSALTGGAALLAALGLLRGGSWRGYILAGVLIGLAAGTKYQNVLVAASVVLAHLLHWRDKSFAQGGRLVAAGAISVLVFLLTTPSLLLAFDDFQHDINTLLESYSSTAIAHGDVTGSWPVGAYLRFYWRECLGPVPFLLALVGAGVLFHRDPASGAVLLLFPMIIVLSLLRPETHFYRNLLPTQPPLMMLAGVGGVALLERAAHALSGRTLARLPWSWLAAAGGVALILAPSALKAAHTSARLAQPDSRVVAQEYARREWPGVRIASELSHPLRWNNVAQSTYVHYLPLNSINWYRQHGYGLLLANAGRRGTDAWTADYEPLLEAGHLAATFGGRDSTMLGPRIDLIETGLTTETLSLQGSRVRLGPLHLHGATVGKLTRDETGPKLIEERSIQPGQTLAVTLFWSSSQPVPPAPYTTFLHMRADHSEGTPPPPLQRDAPPWHGLFPPSTWQPGALVSEQIDLWLPYETPPGTYHLVMGLYNSETMARYPAFVGTTHLAHDEVDLGRVTVVQ